MFEFFKKKTSGKPKAAVFVDYEHWYCGYHNKVQMKPNVEEWIDELKQEYEIHKLYIFGDFSEPKIGTELEKLKVLTDHVVHTASTKEGVDKDFTDIMILDTIYRSMAEKNNDEVYILFTGDAHFTKVVEYLKEKDKKVIIYGVKFAFSNALKSAATSYVEMPRQEQERNHYNDLILISLDRLRTKNASRKPSYWKTIESVASYNRVSKSRVKTALDGMINQKYIEVTTKKTGRNHEYTQQLLEVDWTQLKEDGLWQQSAAR